MISRRTVLALAATVALTAGTFVWTPVKAGQDILIGGGSVTGVYYQVALNVCNLLNKHAGDKYNCVGRPALGSVFNILAVKRTLLDIGVAQSDRNFEAFRGRGDWEGKPMEDLRSVFSMHPETVLLVTRADTGINSVSDLKGKTVNIGNPGSGQRGNAEDELRLYGIYKDSDIDAQGLQQQEASRALVDQKIDAFFYTVGNPSAAIEEPANSTQIKIIPINDAAIYGFVDERPYYVMTVSPAGTYKGVDEDVETYAVTATVVTSASASEEMVYDTVKTVFENLDELKATHAAFRVLEPKAMLKGLTAPLH
ncbi:MAG: TAXI family TRAP transporter solute-binding subunit, partial [Alphaproteobacteria bacterium]